MSAANTLADLNEAAKAVMQCLKGLPEQADVRIALIGGLALWNYLPQYRSTTDADFIITIEVCGRRLEAPKKKKDADDAYNLLVDATKDGNLRLNSRDNQIIEVCLPDVIKHSSSGQTEKWWREKLGMPVSRTPSPTRPRGLSPKPTATNPAAGASKTATGASKTAAGASKPPGNAAGGAPAGQK
ncbi:hypothetical protein INS49_007652 [Diaporthe citri]|uniref:uncharacterized protein n=1 Tax=Diaporthe citri TaxID=83186 RepID=UPI001C8199DA|nr:uncharacterized protein INS49_007652 [Diaporthe citri]KAG6362560.1 hypothetical protein INS49_007652 [Diaporthe citri]